MLHEAVYNVLGLLEEFVLGRREHLEEAAIRCRAVVEELRIVRFALFK